MRRSLSSALCAPLWLLALSILAPAQTHAPERVVIPYHEDTGLLFANAPGVLATFEVEVGGAGWLRLHFEDLQLGGTALDPERGIVRMTSRADGAVQHLDALTADQWGQTSAYFNGESVLVELLAGPGAGGCRVALRAVEAGLPPMIPVSICDGFDERVPSNDPHVARLMPVGCTGWLFDDCYRFFLTAGHCTGNLSVAQFNVPLSNSNGSVNHPPPSEQYALDPSSLYTSGSGGTGNDWAYFGTFPNTETGQTPFQRQAAFHVLGTPPSSPGASLRLTGYGTASGILNQAQKTDDGPLFSLSGTTLRHRVDTTGGNSGSPIVRQSTGHAVAVHTHGGCTSSGGSNVGTSVLHSGLVQALAAPKGICATPMLLIEQPPSTIEPGTAPQIAGRWIADPLPGSAFVRYRTDGGSFQSIPIQDLGGGLVGATLPVAACGQSPEWYVELDDAACGPKTFPAGAPAELFTHLVGELETIFVDDMEQDLGWTTEILGATTGWWQRGVPVNDPSWPYAPAADADGSGQCWLTQNEPGNTDVDHGAVRLTSYPLALPSAPASIEYAYFLRMTNPAGVDRLLVEVRVEPAGPWTVIADHDTNGGLVWHWNEIGPAQLAAAGVPQGATIRLRFTANDDDPQSIVEAAVDALSVRALQCNGGVGTNTCVSGANGATISASGSASIAANDLVLTAEGMPPFANGIFFYGDGLQQTPIGNGFLCVSGSSGLFRLQPALNSGASGSFSRAVDLSSPPSPAGTITAGSTWHFQAWFRDGGSTDLSNALSIDFVP